MIRRTAQITNSLKWNLLTLLEQRPLLFTAMGVNLFNGMLTTWQISSFGSLSKPSLGDVLFVVYAGPGLGGTNLTIVSTWLLNLFFFLLLSARLINEQANTGDYSILIRMASRKQWLGGILASIFIYAFFYVGLLILCALLGIGFVQGWNVSSSNFFQNVGIWEQLSQFSFAQAFGLIWLLLFSSFIAQGLLLILFMMRTQKIIWGLLIMLALALLAWLSGSGDTVHMWQIWLPATHSILSRHYPLEVRLPMLTFGFSFVYNASLSFIITSIITATIKNMDFLGDSHDNQ